MKSSDGLSHDPSKYKLMVPIYCPECGERKDIDMNDFWKKHKEAQRFQNTSCKNCKKGNKLGKWQRRPYDKHNSIENWLRHNDAYNIGDRKGTLTVDVYLTQDIPADFSHKRSLPDAATPKKSKRHKK